MSLLALVTLTILAAVASELVLPGRALYHSGWYNAALVALIVVLGFQVRREMSADARPRLRTGLVSLCLGIAVAGFAAAASGLLAPDNALVIGAPGTVLPNAYVGASLGFPSIGTNGATPASIDLVRGRQSAPIGAWRYTGASILSAVTRTVLLIRARDDAGAGLTITQPTEGAAFLSPVLLLTKTQPILGMDLPFDTFALPAVHRIVQVVFFAPAQVAMQRALRRSPFSAIGTSAVLFAVEDETGAELPHGFRLASSGQSVSVAGLRLTATALSYPAVEIVAAPSQPALLIAAILIIAGIVLIAKSGSGASPRTS